MEPQVVDAAIVASAQKIEHYEICGYGTARAYARELNLGQVAELLEETLDEEYEADDRLTWQLAV
jgi:ferritin-like metal-binding protein YciE